MKTAVEKLKEAVVNYRNWELDRIHYEHFQDGEHSVWTFREVFSNQFLQFRNR